MDRGSGKVTELADQGVIHLLTTRFLACSLHPSSPPIVSYVPGSLGVPLFEECRPLRNRTTYQQTVNHNDPRTELSPAGPETDDIDHDGDARLRLSPLSLYRGLQLPLHAFFDEFHPSMPDGEKLYRHHQVQHRGTEDAAQTRAFESAPDDDDTTTSPEQRPYSTFLDDLGCRWCTSPESVDTDLDDDCSVLSLSFSSSMSSSSLSPPFPDSSELSRLDEEDEDDADEDLAISTLELSPPLSTATPTSRDWEHHDKHQEYETRYHLIEEYPPQLYNIPTDCHSQPPPSEFSPPTSHVSHLPPLGDNAVPPLSSPDLQGVQLTDEPGLDDLGLEFLSPSVSTVELPPLLVLFLGLLENKDQADKPKTDNSNGTAPPPTPSPAAAALAPVIAPSSEPEPLRLLVKPRITSMARLVANTVFHRQQYPHSTLGHVHDPARPKKSPTSSAGAPRRNFAVLQHPPPAPSKANTYHGHEFLAKLAARFVTRLFACPDYPQSSMQAQAKLPYFIAYALHRTKLHPSVTFAALVLLQRLKARFPSARGSSGHRSWCIVAQGMFTLREVNQMEREMCTYLDWELTVDNRILSNFEDALKAARAEQSKSNTPFDEKSSSTSPVPGSPGHNSPTPGAPTKTPWVNAPETPSPTYSSTTSPASSGSPATPVGGPETNPKIRGIDTLPEFGLMSRTPSVVHADPLLAAHLVAGYSSRRTSSRRSVPRP
ncbi:hypothetical protein CVT26_005305 [Gymnopilus dilepis]|uniref:Cyclin N-terminal domain-containing protein n=1 Tax=Gymnopilus dilepis TaxID=231916 RepID=A0A409YVU1_9AGAR|nr:hypothetical protein CVT26_005305 [Gymnopilus dilepis]